MAQKAAVICVLITLIFSCPTAQSAPWDSIPATGIPGVEHENFPRLNGSTSTMPLVHLIIAESLKLPCQLARRAEPLYFGTNVGSLYPAFDPETHSDQFGMYQTLQHQCLPYGTHEAYTSLIAPTEAILEPEPTPSDPTGTPGTMRVVHPQRVSDIILVAREPSEDEIALCVEKQVELDVRPVAMDAFVFLVNSANPVTSLKREQLRDIFSGKVRNWDEVGGPAQPLAKFTRNRNSGSQELIESLVMDGVPVEPGMEPVMLSMMGPIDGISSTENGISYSVFYYENWMARNSKVRQLGVDGVIPSFETIKNGTYPLTTPVYVVTRKDLSPDSSAARLRDWLLSPDGQKIVDASGYVPLSDPD